MQETPLATIESICIVSIKISEYYEDMVMKIGSIKGPQFLVRQTKAGSSGLFPYLQML